MSAITITNYITIAIMIGTGSWGLLTVARFIKRLLSDEMTIVNRRTGKSITLGKHHRKGQAQELLDVLK